MANLTNKHVIIVGGSRGIGAASAIQAARAGASVSIVYRNDDAAAERVVAEITNAGGSARAFKADASEESLLNSAIARSVQSFGSIDGLVVSAGIFVGKSLNEMTVDFWDHVMSANLKSTFLSLKGCQPHFAPTGASVVIYTSTAGQRGSSVFSAYATSKGAQILFMRSMALELAPLVRVNCIAPAWTETEMADASLTELGRDEVAKSFPLGRIGQPDDVARATVFLLSDDSGFITGTTVTVDGGMDLRG